MYGIFPQEAERLSASSPIPTSDADFTYFTWDRKIVIIDLNTGSVPVSADIVNVLRKIEYYHQGSIAGFEIVYREASISWSSVQWHGEHAVLPATSEPTAA